MTAPAVDLAFTNLSDPVMYSNPYPRYEELRRNSPVSRVKAPMMIKGTGYLLTRFDDVQMLHSDPRFSTNPSKDGIGAKMKWALPKTVQLLTETMVFKDDPDHKRLRTLVHKAFTPKLIMGMSEDIKKIAAELIEEIAAKKDIDLVDDFAIRLPLTVIATMLGVSDADRDKFHHWSNKISATAGTGPVGMIKSIPTSNKLLNFFQYLADEGKLHPDDGLISNLVRANEDGDKLSEREIVAMIFILLLAGHDTTANLIGSSILALINNPDQMEYLREDPEDRMDNAIEELLRYVTPVVCGTTRIAKEDMEIAGTHIAEGSQVLGMIISANRDEDAFENPNKLDLSRTPNRHLSFAFGTHYCLGHQLARLEGKIALTQLLERFDNFEPLVPQSELHYKPTISLRGLSKFPLRVS